MNKKAFTKEEIEFILDNRLRISSRKIAAALNCSKSKVQSYFRKNKLSLPVSIINEFRKESLTGRTSFTPKMDAFLLDNYLMMPVKPLGAAIGKSYTGIMIRLRQLGLIIPKEIRDKRKELGRIQTGTPGWNKGMKQSDYMSPEKIAKTAKTRFKTGDLPHNTYPEDGAISLRKDTSTGITYKYIRVSIGKWELFHRLVWEKAHGTIPAGYCIRFIDGNSLNCCLENLQPVTLAKNLEMNWHCYPPELKTVIKLTNKISKLL